MATDRCGAGRRCHQNLLERQVEVFTLSDEVLRPLQRFVMPRICIALLAGHCKQCLRIDLRNSQQRARRPAGLLPALFPTLKRATGNAEQPGKLRLRQPRTFARLNCG